MTDDFVLNLEKKRINWEVSKQYRPGGHLGVEYSCDADERVAGVQKSVIDDHVSAIMCRRSGHSVRHTKFSE